MVAVKICGLSTLEAIDACIHHGAAFAGYICYPDSPRHVSADHFGSLASHAQKSIQTVLVTVDATDDLLEAYLSHHRPNYLQCHGGESPERLTQIKGRFGLPLIKSLPVQHKGDLYGAAQYRSSADMLLLDAKPAAGELPGGNARSFDWALLADTTLPLPWILSGGLTRENIPAALAASGASMLDISSGVESSRGVKSPQLIRELLDHVRSLSENT